MLNKIKAEWLRLRVGAYGLVVAVGAVVSALTLLGFGGRFWWAFDLFSHFQIQYLLGTSTVIVLLLLARRLRAALIFVLFAAINLYFIIPYYVFGTAASAGSSTGIKALTLNVNSANEHYELVKQLIRSANPDVVLLTEVTPTWTRAMEDLHGDYTYQRPEPREDNFGLALYSKLPLNNCTVVFLGAAGLPSLSAEIDIDGRRVTLLGTHPLPPISDRSSRLRNDQLLAVAGHLRATPGPKILLGDLNTSPWSYWFRRLIEESGMKDRSLGKGIRPTWPTDSILFRIPIDYCLVSEEMVVKDRQIGPDIGSDHFPVIVDLALRP